MKPTLQLAAGRYFAAGLAARTVLVVEDEQLVREIIVTELQDAGYVVLEAETAEQGLDILNDKPVHVLFTDIRLPGALDGWDVAEHCRASHPSLPVIYASGYSHKEARPVPGSVYIAKPYRPSQLVKVIHDLVGSTSEA